MSRKLIGMLSLLLLAGVLSGVSYANASPAQISFGPSGFNSVTFAHSGSPGETVTFSGVFGPASLFDGFTSTLGTFTISDATVAFTVPDGFGGYLVAPTPQLIFTVALNGGAGSLVGVMTLEDVSTGQSWAPQLLGRLSISSSTGLFPLAGFNQGMTVDTDFAVYLGRTAKTVNQLWTGPGSSSGYVSGGEVTLDSSVPEPGTIALMGTGLLGLAGYLRRRS
jgi:hypothetical protein